MRDLADKSDEVGRAWGALDAATTTELLWPVKESPITPKAEHPGAVDVTPAQAAADEFGVRAELICPVSTTWSGQRQRHARLLAQLAEALAALRQALRENGHWDRMLIMSYSEFGRRVPENASGGTDHGAAAPRFLMGGRVRGRHYGALPDLTALERRALRYTGGLAMPVPCRNAFAPVSVDRGRTRHEFLSGRI